MAAFFALGLFAFPAFASSEKTVTINGQVYTNEDVIDLACSVWPEHAGKLRNPAAVPQTRAMGTDPVVVDERIQLNETQEMAYIEQASGFAFTVIVSNWYDNKTEITNSGRYEVHTGNFFSATSSCSSSLLGFQYTIDKSNSDFISDYGYFNNYRCSVLEHGRATYEGYSSPAYYTYQIYFYDEFTGNLLGSTIINLSVQNNSFSWTSSGG